MNDWASTDDAAETLPTTWTDAGAEYLATVAVEGRDPYGVTAEIVVARDQPAQCIIFEQTATGIAQLTTWVTATEGSFVSLEEMQ